MDDTLPLDFAAPDNPWSTDDEFVAQVAARAKLFRADRRLSLQDAADLAGITKSYLWDFERGKAGNPTIRFLIGLARAYGVGLDVLLGKSSGGIPIDPEVLALAVRMDELLRRKGGKAGHAI